MTKPQEPDAYTRTVLHQFPYLERHLLCADMRATTNNLLRLTVEGVLGDLVLAEKP